jgi:hypothetical protein
MAPGAARSSDERMVRSSNPYEQQQEIVMVDSNTRGDAPGTVASSGDKHLWLTGQDAARLFRMYVRIFSAVSAAEEFVPSIDEFLTLAELAERATAAEALRAGPVSDRTCPGADLVLDEQKLKLLPLEDRIDVLETMLRDLDSRLAAGRIDPAAARRANYLMVRILALRVELLCEREATARSAS